MKNILTACFLLCSTSFAPCISLDKGWCEKHGWYKSLKGKSCPTCRKAKSTKKYFN